MDDIRFRVDIGRVIIAGPAHPGGGDTAFFSGDEATMLGRLRSVEACPKSAGAAVQMHRHLVLLCLH